MTLNSPLSTWMQLHRQPLNIGHGLYGGLATKPGFDFRHPNWPLLRANKASPVLPLFATLIVHDKHVSSQDRNMPL